MSWTALVYSFRTSHGPADRRVDLAFTDRFGGVSGAPYAELNLASDDGDDPRARAENVRRVLADFAPGDTLADLHQVHGGAVDVVEERPGDHPEVWPGGRPDADAVVTATRGRVLMVRAADCVPVLLADPVAGADGVIGAVHCGRPGLLAQVVQHTVRRLRGLGAADLTAWIGPHVCGACYEVPAAMQADVAARVPASLATTAWGTPSLDLGAGVRAQLEDEGVTVHDVSRCTRESDDLYSYRRDGRSAGRLAGLVRIGP